MSSFATCEESERLDSTTETLPSTILMDCSLRLSSSTCLALWGSETCSMNEGARYFSLSSSAVPTAMSLPWCMNANLSTMYSASMRLCEVKKTVLPSETYSLRCSLSFLLWMMSTPSNGSSRNISGTSDMSTLARETRCLCPMDRWAILRSMNALMSARSATLFRAACRSDRFMSMNLPNMFR